jgi:hypothetical protein
VIRAVVLLILVGGAVGYLSSDHIWPEVGDFLRVAPPLSKAVLVVSLGGDVREDRAAASIWKSGRVGRVWLPHAAGELTPYFCQGVSSQAAVRSFEKGATLADDATALLRLMLEQQFTSVIVVTPPYRVRRTRLVLERTFVGQGIQFGVEASSDESGLPEQWWTVPSWRKIVAMEYAGLLFYRLML